MKLGDKVKIVKGIAKSNEIYVVVSIPFEVAGVKVVHIENIKTGKVKRAISFLEKVESYVKDKSI